MTTLFQNTAVPTVPPIDAPAPPRKHPWLPVLTVLFLISYGLMTMLIVEQGATIESQRALIRELFRDSTELSATRMKAQQEKNVADTQRHVQAPSAKTQAPAAHNPSSQYPMTQYPSAQIPSSIPSTQAPTKQTPSSQAVPQRRTLKETQKKPQFQMPSKPAPELVDDVRALITI